jgi:hypothetical protein
MRRVCSGCCARAASGHAACARLPAATHATTQVALGCCRSRTRKRDGGERNLCRVPRSCERTLLPDLPARDVFALCVFVLILLVKCLNSPYR